MKLAKRLFFIRHGEAQHNIAWYKYGEKAYYMKEITDPKLTNIGEGQAIHLGNNFKEKNSIDLVIVSPLMRCLQTATNIFMGENVQIIACEEAREFPMGLQYTNKRSNKSLLRKEFPHVNFINLKTDEDKLWNSERLETLDELNARTKNLYDYIKKRPEKNIAVVSHSTFIMNVLYDNVDESHNKELKHCYPYKKLIGNIDSETHMVSSF
jgi:broad specificity phosphatase PhoE